MSFRRARRGISLSALRRSRRAKEAGIPALKTYYFCLVRFRRRWKEQSERDSSLRSE